jgi:hypothetical protein
MDLKCKANANSFKPRGVAVKLQDVGLREAPGPIQQNRGKSVTKRSLTKFSSFAIAGWMGLPHFMHCYAVITLFGLIASAWMLRRPPESLPQTRKSG